MVDKATYLVSLTSNEVQTLLHHLTTTWPEPANQENVVTIMNKLRDAVRLGEGSKLDRQSS
jgi:hypothetical protein